MKAKYYGIIPLVLFLSLAVVVGSYNQSEYDRLSDGSLSKEWQYRLDIQYGTGWIISSVFAIIGIIGFFIFYIWVGNYEKENQDDELPKGVDGQ